VRPAGRPSVGRPTDGPASATGASLSTAPTAAGDVESYLKAKAAKSILSVAESVMSAPEVRRAVRRALAGEGLRQGALLCLMFAGVFSIINSIRSALSPSPLVDAVAGSVMVATAVIAMKLYLR